MKFHPKLEEAIHEYKKYLARKRLGKIIETLRSNYELSPTTYGVANYFRLEIHSTVSDLKSVSIIPVHDGDNVAVIKTDLFATVNYYKRSSLFGELLKVKRLSEVVSMVEESN